MLHTVVHKQYYKPLSKQEERFAFTSAFENYVNELPIWEAHCIFCLAWVDSEMLAVLRSSRGKAP
ncbi:hypothetical protein CN425_26875 [Bacillus cereus]|uniref:Uncharacterized protein n=1 Tax=Bacillus cereus TaxID=1396 RepID=A0A2A8PNT5_BACCE|nr:hypothetical protein CON38_07805 [Bacillus cereus]PEV95197.1 hypothetical protein CN425_26875 [Bacillus cereus]PFI26336.1 hypothetical protein COI75_01600 [Bacillus cereus]